MEIYLIKSTAILAIFWMLYVLFLEKENMHRFKRFYLITSVVVAFVIPLLSITEYVYVEPLKDFDFSNANIPFTINEPLEVIETSFWTLEHIVWSIYFLGVAIFSFRFIKNLFSIVKTIQSNEKQKQSSITFVLLKSLINPHTFFNFIFLNKFKFQKNEVPKEVLLHEEVHAKQKHSLDILFIELMQIVFWFQPFIWLFKTRIKLNHEFLADQAVIDAGFKPSTYQNTLLNYSSHQDYSLANAIDYSSIKKRFTVMKTQTSKQKKWALRLLVLPLIGLLSYSFSQREIIEVELEEKQEIHQKLDYTINVDENSNLYFEEEEFELNEVEKFIPIIDNLQIKLELDSRFDSTKLQDLMSEVMTEFTKRGVRKLSVCSAQNFENDEQQNPATAKEVAAYNAWAKKINKQNDKAKKAKNGEYAIVKHKEVLKYKAIYDRMTKAQKNNSETWPSFPPPPPPPPAAPKVIKGSKNKNDFPPPPPPPFAPKQAKGKLTMGHINAYNEWMTYIKSDKANAKYMTVEIYEAYRDLYEAMTDEQKKLTEGAPPPPPPPAPKKADKIKGGPNANELVSDYKSCLEVPKSFITKEGKTLNIKCINDYNENKFQVFNRWGNLIYSKENYNNNWDGTVEKTFAQKGSNKPKSGTYYYVFSSPELKEPKTGYIYINEKKIDGVEIKKSKEKGGPNAEMTLNTNLKTLSGKFEIQMVKNGENISLKCNKGCQWENLKFDLRNNSPMIVNQFGLNRVDPQSSNKAFYFVLHQDDGTFTLKSTKNTSWKGFSSSSKENFDLTFSNEDVKRNK